MPKKEIFISIPGYVVHRLLGVGGMAKVYLATQKSLQREVAIKVLLNPSDEQFAKRFMAEALTIAGLNHPRVITIYDVAQLDDGCLYFVMEYLSGGDLGQFKGQVIPPQKALNYVRQIAEGLDLIHKSNIIHRDIKPANVLFRSDGSLVLSDFGIAKNILHDSDLTQTGCSVGSPSYGSPEQTRELELDQRTDIYSLGVVFLEMLLGYNPYLGNSITETAVNHLQMNVPSLPNELNGYQFIIDKMLAKNPDERFANMSELFVALNKAILYSTREGDDTQIMTGVNEEAVAFGLNEVEQGLQPKAESGLFKSSIFSIVSLLAFIIVVYFFTYESEADKKVKSLLKEAQTSIQEGRFDQPELNNAYYFYNEALLLDVNNKSAIIGLQRLPQKQVAYYLKRGKECIEEQNLSTPERENAIFFYTSVLKIEPENTEAKAGIKQLTEMYVHFAQSAFSAKEYRHGFEYLKLGLELDPGNEALILLREEHRHQSNSFKRLFNRVFK